MLNKYFRGILAILSVFLLVAAPAYATNSHVLPVFEHIRQEDGLSNEAISAIVQDKDGFLWIATQDGLNLYDGHRFETLRHKPFDDTGLLHNLIQTMAYKASSHELYIGTYQGLSRLDLNTKTFKNYKVRPDGLSHPVVTAIAFESEEAVWIGTLDGLNRLDLKTDGLTAYQLEGKAIRALHYSADGTLYVGTDAGLYTYDVSCGTICPVGDLPKEAVMSLSEAQDGTLLVGVWGHGLYRYTASKGVKQLLEATRLYTHLSDSRGSIWVGTWGDGLYQIHLDGTTEHLLEEALPSTIVYSLATSTSDILWVGTNGGGLVKIDTTKRNFIQFAHKPSDENSLSQGKVQLLYPDTKGRLWAGVYNKGVERLNSDTGTTEKYPLEETGSIVSAAVTLPDGLLVFGGNDGLKWFDATQNRFRPYPIGLPKDVHIYSLAYQAPDTLWVGTATRGLYAYTLKTGGLAHFRQEAGQLSDNAIYALAVDPEDTLWVGTNDGLNVLKKNATQFNTYFRTAGDHQSLPSNAVRTLAIDHSGDVWIGSVGGGLTTYDADTDAFITYTETDGLSNNTVLGILEDGEDTLWLSTLFGLNKFDKSSKAFEAFYPEDGVGGYTYASGYAKHPNGDLLFGGIDAIAAIDAQYLSKPLVLPRLYVTEIAVNQHPVDYSGGNQTFEWAHEDNSVTFNLTAIEYANPGKITYYARLNGHDTRWLNLGQTPSITYSNLPPGSYHFEAYAKSYSGIVSDKTRISFVIKRPWFQTPWAMLLYALLLGTVVKTLFKLKAHRVLIRKNAALQQVNSELESANCRLEALSIKDPLTGLYNRRYFDNVFEQHIQLALRSDCALGLLMIDIDNFKEINDTFGHVIGDELLKSVGACLKETLQRRTDFACRFGGDEFVVALYDTNRDGVVHVAKNIKQKLRLCGGHLGIAHAVTVSTGVYSAVPALGDTVTTYVDKADDALYTAKSQGKDRIIYAGDPVLD